MDLTTEEREILTEALEALMLNRKRVLEAFGIELSEIQTTKIINLYHKVGIFRIK